MKTGSNPRSTINTLEQRLEFLLEASAVLSESLDYESRLRRLAEISVPTIADWCAVDIPGGEEKTNRLAVIHSDPAKIDLVFEIERRYPAPPDDTRGIYKVLKTGVPDLYREIPEQVLTAAARDDEHLGLIRQLGLRSAMVVPPAMVRGKASRRSMLKKSYSPEKGAWRRQAPGAVPTVRLNARVNAASLA